MYPDMKHKYIVSHHQRFSKCYNENTPTKTIYVETFKHLVEHALGGNKSVCMMYGQTGSGKTYTMGGFFEFIAEDLYKGPIHDLGLVVSVTTIEIVGSLCHDLLQNNRRVRICEDGDGSIQLLNASCTVAESSKDLLEILERVKELRSTEATGVNSQSSRSHLVCYINLYKRAMTRNVDIAAENNKASLHGQMVLLDLAGSERKEDSFHHDAARRKEAIEINKSHLALKQCIRAIGSENRTDFVPYRASSLTRILKGCLWSQNSRASVIATISPISIDTEHTLYTLLCAGQMLEDNPVIAVDKTDVTDTLSKKHLTLVRYWDNNNIVEWISSLNHGIYTKYALNLGSMVNGRLITRYTVARFTQLCNGNSEDGAYIYNALRSEMARQQEVLKAHRAHNIACHKG